MYVLITKQSANKNDLQRAYQWTKYLGNGVVGEYCHVNENAPNSLALLLKDFV